MIVTIYTPSTILFEDLDARAVYLPSADGDMEVLEDHIPVLVSLKKGLIKISLKNGEKIETPVDLGYAQFSNNKFVIVIQKTEITEEEIERIQAKASSLKDKIYKKDTIKEEEFENFEDGIRK